MKNVAVRDLPASLVSLAGALRACGVAVTLRDELDAAEALWLVDLADAAEVGRALRIALKIPRSAFEIFDRLFRSVWTGGSPAVPGAPPPPAPSPRPGLPRGRLLHWDPEQGRMADAPGAPAEGEWPSASPDALLRRKSFDEGAWSAQDLAAMERILARLARRLAARPSRRLVPTEGRGRPDLRRSYRRALRTCGEVLSFARRAPDPARPSLVFLCDTSGSMDAHTRFLLSFVLALRGAARRAEVFAFNTELVRLTSVLSPGKVRLSLDRLAAAVPDWSGGTRIGESLARFVADHLPRCVDAKTVVVILSDGLDRGDPALLVEAVRRIGARARKLVWLNPLLGDARYQPAAQGMQAALPFVDHFASAHNLESLERLLPHLGA